MQRSTSIWSRRFLNQQLYEQVPKIEHAKDSIDIFFPARREMQKPEYPDKFFNLIILQSDILRALGLAPSFQKC